ncbi:MAG: TrkA C-terminal domain-containing protein [Halalkalicoccus sp.]
MVGTSPPNSVSRLDEIDRRIIYELMSDARNRSPPAIAESIDVAPGTVRSRIEALENDGVIDGYHAHIDFERIDGRLTVLFMCNVPFARRESISRAAHAIPGVISVRVMMGGRRSFHVLAVGEDTDDLRRIGTTLSELDVEIEDEMLVESDDVRPYSPFDPETETKRNVASEIGFSGTPEVVEVAVEEDAPIAGMTIAEAARDGILDDEPLIVALERGEEMLTPHGDTALRSGDVVTVFSCGGVDETMTHPFVDGGTGAR